MPRCLGVAAILATAAFFALVIALPIGALFRRGLSAEILFSPEILEAVRATATQAGWSTAISAAIGLPLGLWVGRLSPARTAFARACLAIPYGVPSLVAASAWVLWLGRSGWLARAGFGIGAEWSYTMRAVILAHSFLNIPLVALLVAQTRMQIPARLLEVASVLGAGAWARFRFVLWPELRWALGAGAAQVFGLCSMSFALVLILGGGPPVETLETALYARIRSGSVDFSGAAACALWELALTLLPWLLLMVARAFATRAGAGAGAAVESRAGRGWEGRALGAVCFLAIAPYLVILLSSPPTVFFDRELLSQLARPLAVSLELAACSAFGALTVAALGLTALASARSRAARALLLGALSLPAGVSILVVGLGFWFAYGAWLDPFSGSFAAMVILQIALFAPVAFRVLWPLASGVQRRLLEAAVTLGASPLRAFWCVEWPRWRIAVGSALGLVAAASLGEVAAVSLFFSEDLVPVPLLITRWMGQYRFREAEALAGVLLILSAGAAWAFTHAARGKPLVEGAA